MIKKCEICGNQFNTKSHNTKRCDNCKHINICLICGKQFETIASERKGSRLGKRKTCSKECSNKLREQTNLKKYGTKHIMQSEETKNKIKKTNLKRYGVENVFQSREVLKILDQKRSETIKKQQETMLERYGYKSSFSKPEVQEKVRQTHLEKYGGNPFQNKLIKEKIISTNKEKYGVPYYCTFNLIKTVSKANKQFQDFLKQEGIETELEFPIDNMSYDLHILNTNILIEINPTYTHNSTNPYKIGKKIKSPKEKDYHLNKTKLALKNNYQILNIFDWDNLEEIISILKKQKLPEYQLKIRKNFYNQKTKDRIIDLKEKLNEKDLINQGYVVIYDVI